MFLQTAAVSNIGLVREQNEDMLLVMDRFIRDGSYAVTIDPQQHNGWLAVADGMGGHNAGEIASEWVLQQMALLPPKLPKRLPVGALHSLLTQHAHQTHRLLNILGDQNEEMLGLGTTFTGLLWYEAKPYVVHAGDSRLYRFRKGRLKQLTTDHTARRQISELSLARDVLTNCFGGSAPFMFIDFIPLARSIQPGDQLLLCSNGLSSYVPGKTIQQALQEGGGANDLMKIANENGGYDNVSCIVVSVGG